MIAPPTLTPPEKAALEWALRSDRKGGAGWSRQSPAGAQVLDILVLGQTRDDSDERLLEHVMSMQDRAVRG